MKYFLTGFITFIAMLYFYSFTAYAETVTSIDSSFTVTYGDGDSAWQGESVYHKFIDDFVSRDDKKLNRLYLVVNCPNFVRYGEPVKESYIMQFWYTDSKDILSWKETVNSSNGDYTFDFFNVYSTPRWTVGDTRIWCVAFSDGYKNLIQSFSQPAFFYDNTDNRDVYQIAEEFINDYLADGSIDLDGFYTNNGEDFIDTLNPPSDMSMSVTDYCTKELKGGDGDNDNVIITFTMYTDDYIDGSIFKTHITLSYDVPIYNNLSGMDSIKWEVKHPFTSRYQSKSLKINFDYELQPEDIKIINERKEKYDFKIKIPKTDIYAKIQSVVSDLDYKDCKKWIIADKNENGIFTYDSFLPLKKVETKNLFYLQSTHQRTPYFYLDTTMKLYTNNDVLYTTDGVTTNKTVGEQEIFDYTDKNGNNTEWADSVDFDPEKVLANENGYSWDNESNHKNFIGILVDLFESIKEFPRFMRQIFFYMPEFVFTLIAVVMSVIVVMRILGR